MSCGQLHRTTQHNTLLHAHSASYSITVVVCTTKLIITTKYSSMKLCIYGCAKDGTKEELVKVGHKPLTQTTSNSNEKNYKIPQLTKEVVQQRESSSDLTSGSF